MCCHTDIYEGVWFCGSGMDWRAIQGKLCHLTFARIGSSIPMTQMGMKQVWKMGGCILLPLFFCQISKFQMTLSCCKGSAHFDFKK